MSQSKRKTLFFTYEKWFGNTEETRELRMGWMTLLITLGTLAFLALLVGLGTWADSRACYNLGVETGIETTFRIFGGCFVDLGDGSNAPVDENSIGLVLRYLIEQG